MIEKICGVYMIQSVIKPERIYVGSSVNIKERWRQHRKRLKNGTHHSIKLQRHYDKYGLADLIFEVIEDFKFICKLHLFAREAGWYERFQYKDTLLPYFNVCTTPSGGGIILSESARDKIRQKMIGRVFSEETLKKMSESRKGMKMSDETKKKLSENKKNDPRTKVQIDKMAEINKGNQYCRGCTWNIGRKHSPEVIEKTVSKLRGRPSGRKGIPFTEDHKQKISKALKGKKKSPEHVEKNRQTHLGKKRSEESKIKQREHMKDKYIVCPKCGKTMHLVIYNTRHKHDCLINNEENDT